MSKNPLDNTSQLPLDLSIAAGHQREDLIESPANEMAIAMIDAWPQWPGRVSVLAGPVGAGKSHIANVWVQMADAMVCDCADLEKNIDELVQAGSAGGSILIEDAAENMVDETAMFHLLNSVKQGQGYCLITSRYWPIEWDVKLPDLASRLKAAQVFELKEPDDSLLRQVMVKLFADRQLMVDEKVIDYCVLRMERSLESAGKLVAAMDDKALARKSGVTRTIAARALELLGMD